MRTIRTPARAAALAVAMAFCTSAASAQTYSGTTLGGLTYNRQVNACAGASGTGTAVRYSVQALYTTTTGSFTFNSVAVSPSGWDNYLFLYQNTFTATAPATNCVNGNDDFGSIGVSQFVSMLTAGTQYYLVTTGFANTDAGSFTNRVTGPSAVVFGTIGTVVPEPATAALLLSGMLITFGVARRRRA
jgi:hypothetical protein